jgi:hypothetical protein
MKTIPSKLWSVASGNQKVSGGGGDGGGQDQNQSIPDFVRRYNNFIYNFTEDLVFERLTSTIMSSNI